MACLVDDGIVEDIGSGIASCSFQRFVFNLANPPHAGAKRRVAGPFGTKLVAHVMQVACAMKYLVEFAEQFLRKLALQLCRATVCTYRLVALVTEFHVFSRTAIPFFGGNLLAIARCPFLCGE